MTVGRRHPRRLKLLALGVGGLYLFLAGFLVLCLSHHGIEEGTDDHHDHQGWIKEICTWAQKTTSSYLVPEVPDLHAFKTLPLEPVPAQFLSSHPFPHFLSIRAPPPSLR